MVAELAPPGSKLTTGLLSNPAVDLDDRAHLLRDGDEVPGEEKTTLRMLPANQGFEPGNAAVAEGHDRLVVDPKLTSGQRSPQVVLEAQRRHNLLVHLIVEDREAVAAHGLGSIHGGVGVAQQVLWALVARVPQRDADADAGEDFVAVEVEGDAELVLNAFRSCRRSTSVRNIFHHDHELVASEARDGITGAAGFFDPLRNGSQELVSGEMAEAVVDVLEPVEVEEKDGEAVLRVPFGASEGVTKSVHQHGAVRQPGERVLEAG